MTQLFIDIIGGKSEFLDEDEVQEKLYTQPEIVTNRPRKTYRESQQELEDQYILKTRMTLQKEELFVSYVQDFECDDYHKDDTDIPSELERQVRSMKRRYPDFGEYQSALVVYNEYMSYLYAKHGGKELFILKDKGGFISEYVPPLPKIKANASNKELLKNKVVISSKSKNPQNLIDIDDLTYDDILEFTNTTDSCIDYIEYDRIKEAKPDKEFDKFVQKEVLSKSGKYSKYANAVLLRTASSFDYLDEYFNNKNSFDEEEKKHSTETDDLLLEDLVNDNFTTAEDLLDDSEEKVYVNGRIMGKSQANEIATYNSLRDLGWDVNKIMRQTGNVSESDIVFKRLKQIDKREKKKKKKDKGKKDNFLSALSKDNGYDDFEAFSRDMLDFSSENIFK